MTYNDKSTHKTHQSKSEYDYSISNSFISLNTQNVLSDKETTNKQNTFDSMKTVQNDSNILMDCNTSSVNTCATSPDSIKTKVSKAIFVKNIPEFY